VHANAAGLGPVFNTLLLLLLLLLRTLDSFVWLDACHQEDTVDSDFVTEEEEEEEEDDAEMAVREEDKASKRKAKVQ
jgi:hypothetical protein